MSTTFIELPPPLSRAVHAGSRVLVSLDDEVVAVVPITDVRKLEKLEETRMAAPDESARREPVRIPANESLEGVLRILDRHGIDPAVVSLAGDLEIRTRDGSVSLVVARETRRDFSREDDD